MGRQKTVGKHLPPHMTARKLKTKTLYYYRTRTGASIPLGDDLAEARIKWAQLERGGATQQPDEWLAVSARYRRDGIKGLSPKTQREYCKMLDTLDKAFRSARLPQIEPHHVRQYLDQRSAKVAANREIVLLSTVINWARERGITTAQNPCQGVRRNKERARDTYVTDEQFAAVWQCATPELQDALDLGRLTGQRPADVRKMRRDDIRDGCLWVCQGKTGTRLGIEITGELATVIDRILTRKRTAIGPWLVQDDRGQALSKGQIQLRFYAARKAAGQTWQLRDLRPKAATDIADLRKAQALLGHASEATTADIYRRRKGEKVAPVK